MNSRNLLTIIFIAALFIFSTVYAYANGENEKMASSVVSESELTLEDQIRFDQLAEILNHSATGRSQLRLKTDYDVKVLFETGKGSSFMQAANRIRLETNLNPVHAALIFAHEMNHAQAFHEGRKAHRKSDSRQDYINKMLWEESEGMAVSIQVKTELEESGVDVGNITLPFEAVYREAYQDAVNQARQSTSPLDRLHLASIARAAGVQALFETHLRGETRTANTHEPCIDYYGRQWDEANPVMAFVVSLLS